MTRKDANLGMDARITRRDLCQGIALAIGAAPFMSLPRETLAAMLSPDYYPPALTGLRGAGLTQCSEQRKELQNNASNQRKAEETETKGMRKG